MGGGQLRGAHGVGGAVAARRVRGPLLLRRLLPRRHQRCTHAFPFNHVLAAGATVGSSELLPPCAYFFSWLGYGCGAAAVVGPVAAALMVLGNVGVILLLFPAHVWWTIYSLIK